jgi:DNA-binding CsgD family transcriptional regulator
VALVISTAASAHLAEHLGSMVDVIGEGGFAERLVGFLHQCFGVDHCAVFRLDGPRPRELVAVSIDGTDTAHRQANLYIETELWRRDPTMSVARSPEIPSGVTILRLNFSTLDYENLRNVIYPYIGDRLLLCGSSTVGRIGLSVLRSRVKGSFASESVLELQEVGGLLLSIIAKHATATWNRRKLVQAFTSLKVIETHIAAVQEHFPRREAQVCSRILYGMSTTGIALELGVGEETIMTYRKRIYERLQIGSQRELMLWYVARCSEVPSA